MKFRKKKVVIDAIQWTGQNMDEIQKLFPTNPLFCLTSDQPILIVGTCRRTQRANLNDWIILDTGGSYYICKDEHFQHQYEALEE